MKDKFLFGMLNDDYRESVLKENEMKKVKSEIREKSKLRKLKESVNINVSSDGAVNVNNEKVNINIEEQAEPIVAEPIAEEIPVEEPEVEEVQEEIIEEGCDKKESCDKKEAEAIVKNPTERGELEFNGYENILKEVAKELLGDLNPENVEVTMDNGNMLVGPDWTGIEVRITPKVEGDYGIEYPVFFDLGVSDYLFGAPGGLALPEGERYLQFYSPEYYDGSEPCIEKKFNAKEIPITKLKQVFVDNLKDKEEVKNIVKQAKDLNDVVQYRADNNITDSEKLKESEIDRDEMFDKLATVFEHYIEKYTTGDFLDDLITYLLPNEQGLIDWYNSINSKNESENLEECEISSYKITRIAPNTGAYMIEAQTKDGLKYIIGKNFNEAEKTLDEAEILDNKVEASNKFRSLLK